MTFKTLLAFNFMINRFPNLCCYAMLAAQQKFKRFYFASQNRPDCFYRDRLLTAWYGLGQKFLELVSNMAAYRGFM